MKTIYLFLFFFFAGLFIKAQQLELTSNTWYLQKMISTNGTETLPPNNSEVSSIRANFGETLMTTEVVNQFGAWTFPGPHIALTNTTMLYDEFAYSTNPCNIPENCTFENDYFSFFQDGLIGIPIYYIITNEGNFLKLTLTHNNGEQAIYYSQNLAVNDIEKLDFKIYPNPVINNLYISTKLSILKVQLYDMLGNIAMSEKIKKEHNSFELNMKNIVSGNYLLIIKDNDDNIIYRSKIIKK